MGHGGSSRELDRILDRRLTFREKLEWLEEAETLSLRLHEQAKSRSIVKEEDRESKEQS